jgi:hydroxyacylglutathione hydrolase
MDTGMRDGAAPRLITLNTATAAPRPRLRHSPDATSAAAALYESLHRLLALPNDLEIYPAHFAGSACGRAMSGKPSSTIGFERRFNVALRPRSREEFIAFMLEDLPAPPAEHARIRAANRRGDAALRAEV